MYQLINLVNFCLKTITNDDDDDDDYYYYYSYCHVIDNHCYFRRLLALGDTLSIYVQ